MLSFLRHLVYPFAHPHQLLKEQPVLALACFGLKYYGLGRAADDAHLLLSEAPLAVLQGSLAAGGYAQAVVAIGIGAGAVGGSFLEHSSASQRLAFFV